MNLSNLLTDVRKAAKARNGEVVERVMRTPLPPEIAWPGIAWVGSVIDSADEDVDRWEDEGGHCLGFIRQKMRLVDHALIHHSY